MDMLLIVTFHTNMIQKKMAIILYS